MVPLAAALYLATSMFRQASAIWFNPEIGEQLDRGVDVYKDYVRAIKDDLKHHDVPALLYKIILLKQFICGPDFPQDIEKGLGEGLMTGLRTYLTSSRVNQLLTPQISDEVKDRVIQNFNIFFEDVDEFQI